MEACNQGLIIESWLNPEIFLLHFTLFLTITSDPAYDINKDVYPSICVFGVWKNIINWPGIHMTLCGMQYIVPQARVYVSYSSVLEQQLYHGTTAA